MVAVMTVTCRSWARISTRVPAWARPRLMWRMPLLVVGGDELLELGLQLWPTWPSRPNPRLATYPCVTPSCRGYPDGLAPVSSSRATPRRLLGTLAS